jgi:transcriptional regulator of heat shock response
MAKLEALGLIYQPYNSAGRLPSSRGLRAFVNYMMQQYPDHFLSNDASPKSDQLNKLTDFAHNICFDLAKNT